MNNPLELVYESMYKRKPINEKFMGIGGKSVGELYGLIKQILHDTYGEDVMDAIISDTNIDDVKRNLYDMIKQSDAEDTIKVRLINRIAKSTNLCHLFNSVLMGSRA